jgi:glycosyltransferase involved in cell wall biosynthesis
MIIFHIPSWYPSQFHPYSGIFIKEYIYGYATEYPDTLNILSNHVENYYAISLKDPLQTIKNIKSIITQKKNRNTEFVRTPNVIELYTNSFWGVSQVLFPFAKKIFLEIHEKNFEYTIKKYGKPDLIHAYISTPGGEMAYKISGKYNVPFIITEHMGPFVSANMLVNGKLPKGMQDAIENASAMISVSQAHSKQIKKLINKHVQIIPNAINENVFYPDNTFAETHSTFTFLTVSSTLHNSKGIDTLINAIKICNDKGIKALFKIGGSEKYLPEAKLSAIKNNIENIIWFAMLTREQVSKAMKQCHAFILASRQESFGVVYAEAIASGKPVIATICGGPEDIVKDLNGLMVPVDDSFALANAIQNMIKNYPKYNPTLIRQDFLNRFSTKAIASQYHKLYADITNH